MKKFILLLVAVMLPLGVNALAVSESFDVGDSVSVALYDGYETENPNGIGFHVLKSSGAGERTVTLIYDGVIDGSSTVYDEDIPSSNDLEAHTPTAVLEQSVAGTVLNQTVNKAGAVWKVDSSSLLSLSDINYLGIQKNALGIYEIPAKYSFLAPIKATGVSAEIYNYWTSIRDDSATSTSVYCVEYNENRASLDDVWATLSSRDITSVTNNSRCGIRPVIVIDKAYILCNNTKNPTTPTNPTTPESPKTGVEDYIIPLGMVALLGTVIVISTKKKNVFNQI